MDPAKASDKRTVQNFRYKVLRKLKKIKLAWKDLNYTTAPGVLISLALDSGHRAAQPRPATKLVTPFPGPQRAVRSLIAPSWTVSIIRAPEPSESINSLCGVSI